MEGGFSSKSSIQQNQLKSNNIGSILQWDDQPIGAGGQKPSLPPGIPKILKGNRSEQQ